jgi:hypothetical protein
MSQVEANPYMRFELPRIAEAARDHAVRLATATFLFEADAPSELQPNEVSEKMLAAEARRIASIDDAADRQTAILQCLDAYVQLAGDAQRLALGFLELAKSVDAVSMQLHDVKESAKRKVRAR